MQDLLLYFLKEKCSEGKQATQAGHFCKNKGLEAPVEAQNRGV